MSHPNGSTSTCPADRNVCLANQLVFWVLRSTRCLAVEEPHAVFSIYREGLDGRGEPATRREVLRAGALSALGLTMPELARLRAATAAGDSPSAPQRANSCVFVFLFGGPSHIDLWDMKPKAPVEIRGEFKPIDTVVPGIQLCEHLPRLARQMGRFCLLRSMTHRMPVHGPACSEMYTGQAVLRPPHDRPGAAGGLAVDRLDGRAFRPPRHGLAAVDRPAVADAVRRPGQADRRPGRRPDGRGTSAIRRHRRSQPPRLSGPRDPPAR